MPPATAPHHLADLLLSTVDGDPWHGSSTAALLADVTAADAAARPVPGGHSIWELVLHMTGWADEVHQRLRGRAAQEPDGGDWPPTGVADDVRWSAAVTRLVAVHRALADTVRATTSEALDAPVVDRREPALGTGLSKFATLHGLIHHTVYHSGQIALVKAALRGR
jgi:uncharacterized damage-inducible protein DinB